MRRVVLTKGLLMLMVSVLITSLSFNTYVQRGPRAFRDSARFECRIPNLTAEQKTKIESLRVKHFKEVTPIKNELIEKRAHLNTLESAETVNKDAITKTIDEISALQAKLMKLKVNHRLDVASNLTDEQKVYFNAHQGMGGRGQMGMGQGMRKGMRRGMGDGMGPNCPNNHPNCPLNKK